MIFANHAKNLTVVALNFFNYGFYDVIWKLSINGFTLSFFRNVVSDLNRNREVALIAMMMMIYLMLTRL